MFSFFLSLGPSRAGSLMGLRAPFIGLRAEQTKVSRPLEKARCRRLSWAFIGDSSPAARVEGARRSPCNAESCKLRPPGSSQAILAPLLYADSV